MILQGQHRQEAARGLPFINKEGKTQAVAKMCKKKEN